MHSNQQGNLLIIVGIILFLLVTTISGIYFFLPLSKQTALQQSKPQTTNFPLSSSSSTSTITESISLKAAGSVAFVFVSKKGQIGFLKQKTVDPGTWGGLTTAGEIWTIENDKPVRLIDDSPILDFVWSPDGTKIVYHKYIPSKEQTFFPFIKPVKASGGFAEGDVILYDIKSKSKTVIGKFFRSDWQTPYMLPKWSDDSKEIIFGSNDVTRYDISTGKSVNLKDVDIRYISPNLEKAVIPDTSENTGKITVRNLRTGQEKEFNGLHSLKIDGGIYTFLWSPDNINLAIIANLTPADREDYNVCNTFIINTNDSDLSQIRKMDKAVDSGLCGYGNVQPIWSPNGKYIQLGKNIFSLDPMNFPNLKITLEERGGGGPSGTAYGVSWSPDSNMFAENFKNKLSIHNLKTNKTVTLDDPTGNWVGVGYRAWLPDSSRLIYNTNGNLVSIKSDGTDKKVLSN